MSVTTFKLHRKYMDLIRGACFSGAGKFVNWDPLHDVKVGSYGLLDKDTGKLCVEGNIYDPEFQQELDKHNLAINLADYPPQEGLVEKNLVIDTTMQRGDFDTGNVPEITNAHIEGKCQWIFDAPYARNAIFIACKPRKVCIPPDVVLEHLYKIDKLVDKCLVTGIYACPAYCMYLSDQFTESVSLALFAPASSTAGESTPGDLTWWADSPTGLLRTGCDPNGEYKYTPLAIIQRPIPRLSEGYAKVCTNHVYPQGDDLWVDVRSPWECLGEDGREYPSDFSYEELEEESCGSSDKEYEAESCDSSDEEYEDSEEYLDSSDGNDEEDVFFDAATFSVDPFVLAKELAKDVEAALLVANASQ